MAVIRGRSWCLLKMAKANKKRERAFFFATFPQEMIPGGLVVMMLVRSLCIKLRQHSIIMLPACPREREWKSVGESGRGNGDE